MRVALTPRESPPLLQAPDFLHHQEVGSRVDVKCKHGLAPGYMAYGQAPRSPLYWDRRDLHVTLNVWRSWC